MRFGANSTFKTVTPVVLPPGRFQTGNETKFYWVAAAREDDWQRASYRL